MTERFVSRLLATHVPTRAPNAAVTSVPKILRPKKLCACEKKLDINRPQAARWFGCGAIGNRRSSVKWQRSSPTPLARSARRPMSGVGRPRNNAPHTLARPARRRRLAALPQLEVHPKRLLLVSEPGVVERPFKVNSNRSQKLRTWPGLVFRLVRYVLPRCFHHRTR